jgi:hypothetical protein
VDGLERLLSLRTEIITLLLQRNFFKLCSLFPLFPMGARTIVYSEKGERQAGLEGILWRKV